MNSSNEISQPEHPEEKTIQDNMGKTDEQVTCEFLLANPNYFTQNNKLLEQLALKHSSGKAVSLIERQVEILRKQNTQLKIQLNSLISIAKENESFTQKMQTLILDLLACHDISGIHNVLQHRLINEFSADCVSLRLFSPSVEVGNDKLILDSDSKQAKELLKIIHKREPECGFFKGLDLIQLFPETDISVASMAIIPLFIDKNHCFGTLILGSTSSHHFNPNMGTIFLENLSQVLSHAIYKYLK